MGSAEVAVVIDAPADEVWKYVGDFGGLGDWMPGVDSCTVEGGDIRKLSVLGLEISEKLLKRNEHARILEYSIVDSPLNAESHLGRVSVHEDGERSRVTWFVEVSPDSLIDILSGTYQQALDALKAEVEKTAG